MFRFATILSVCERRWKTTCLALQTLKECGNQIWQQVSCWSRIVPRNRLSLDLGNFNRRSEPAKENEWKPLCSMWSTNWYFHKIPMHSCTTGSKSRLFHFREISPLKLLSKKNSPALKLILKKQFKQSSHNYRTMLRFGKVQIDESSFARFFMPEYSAKTNFAILNMPRSSIQM